MFDRTFLKLFLFFALLPSISVAQTYYVDAVNGSNENPGTSSEPLKTVKFDFNEVYIGDQIPLNGGDVVILRSGHYGNFFLRERHNDEYIKVYADEGHTPTFNQIMMSKASKWDVRGLTVSSSFNGGQLHSFTIDMVYCQHVEDIIFSDLHIYSVDDISNWDASDWQSARGGVFFRNGHNVSVTDSHIRNVSHGIQSAATNSFISNNRIENYSRDGMRALGSHSKFINNFVINSYKVDDHHDDGIQLFTIGEDGTPGNGVLTGIHLIGNTIIDTDDPNRPFIGHLQGIGAFAGWFEDFVVKHNVIKTDVYHGISFYGIRDSVIAGNIVLDSKQGNREVPWIMITDHKFGGESTNVKLHGNSVPRYHIKGINIDMADTEEVTILNQSY